MASLTGTLGPSAFLETMGQSPTTKLLDFLVVFDEFDHSMADIAEHADVGYSTLKLLLPELERRNIVMKTRTSGRSAMYTLNRQNPAVRRFAEFYWDLARHSAPQQRKKKAIVH